MMKRISILIATMLFAVCMNSMAEGKVWEKPYANNMSAELLTIEKVEFADTATTLFFHCDFIPHNWIRVPKNCFLRFNGKEYPIRSSKGIELDKRFYLPDSGETDFSLSFAPLSNSDQPFDFVEPGSGGWVISYIRSQDYTPAQITDTYWRNMKTGEWLIGFADGNIVYDSKIWRIVQTEAKKDTYAFTIDREGKESRRVAVSRAKKGVRRIAIDGQKAVDCNMIKASVLDGYPEPDEKNQWNKADITSIDTAYISGWMKGLDKETRDKYGKLNLYFHDIFDIQQQKLSVSLDSLGYFEIKMPMMEAYSIDFKYGHSSFTLALEPRKHYFVLYDYKTGQNLVMGDDARVQNEMLARFEMKKKSLEHIMSLKSRNEQITGEEYLDYIFTTYLQNQNIIEQEIRKHPNLSVRYKELLRNSLRKDIAFILWQSGMLVDFKACERYHQFMKDSCMARLPKPLTLYPFMLEAISDYVNSIAQESSIYAVSAAKLLIKEGKLTVNDDELQILDDYLAAHRNYLLNIRNASQENGDSITKAIMESPAYVNFTNLISRIDSVTMEETIERLRFDKPMEAFRSCVSDNDNRSFFAACLIMNEIKNRQEPLSKKLENFVKANISNPVAMNKILAENLKYIDLSNGGRGSIQKSLKTINFGDDSQGGKKKMEEILRPLQGKMVLVDFWGIWCGPCRKALEHCQELYKSLEDYDIAYVYLANQSDEKAWKNFIQKNNVVGDNVYHYNLPKRQQAEIESAFKINAFPSYRLFDREGNLIDMEVDTQNVQSLKSLLDKLGAKRRK